MKRHSRWAFLLLLGFNSCFWWQRGPGDRIRVSGNIELTEVKIAFKVAGRLVELNVEEGAPVRTGTLLARLDAVQLQRQHDREQAGLRIAESQLVQLRTSIEYQRAALSAEIELRQAELKQAEARLDELLAGSREQEIEQATAVAGTSSKAITTAVPIWANQDCAASDTLVEQTAAVGFTTSAAVKHKIVVFQIDPVTLDSAGGFDCLCLKVASGSASNILSAMFLLDYRYGGPVAGMPSAIVD